MLAQRLLMHNYNCIPLAGGSDRAAGDKIGAEPKYVTSFIRSSFIVEPHAREPRRIAFAPAGLYTTQARLGSTGKIHTTRWLGDAHADLWNGEAGISCLGFS